MLANIACLTYMTDIYLQTTNLKNNDDLELKKTSNIIM